MRRGRIGFIIGFLTVPLVLYAVFVIAPYVQAFWIALTDWRGVSTNPRFVGLDNFARMFEDGTFWKALAHNGVLLLVLPLATIAIALFLSFFLSRGVRGAGLYKVVYFFPQVLSVVVVAVVFQNVYRPDDAGLLNGVLDAVGLGGLRQSWLADPDLALGAIIAVMVWQGVGFYVVLFSAGMAAIPVEMYEASKLDGAGPGVTFFRITLPLLWNNVQVAWVYLGIAALDAFAIVYVLSVDKGGPDGATTVLGVEVYRNAFEYYRFGYATALGVALFLLTLTVAALTFRVTRRENVEY